MGRIEFSNDPMLRANQKKKLRKKIIIAAITSLASMLFLVGLLFIVIGSQTGKIPLSISGGIVCGIGAIALIFVGLFCYKFPL